ncbi:MAG: DNA-directed RNA polymerase subunit L [DPANN group archaeon]|nr:DNA-directed RNA polymerase subunit L [DPANN group archaeon]
MTETKHTLPNMLRVALWEDPTVTLAAYEKKHPLMGNPTLIIKAKDPNKALLNAIKKTETDLKDFEDLFKKAMKKA